MQREAVHLFKKCKLGPSESKQAFHGWLPSPFILRVWAKSDSVQYNRHREQPSRLIVNSCNRIQILNISHGNRLCRCKLREPSNKAPIYLFSTGSSEHSIFDFAPFSRLFRCPASSTPLGVFTMVLVPTYAVFLEVLGLDGCVSFGIGGRRRGSNC